MFVVFTTVTYFIVDLVFIEAIQISIIVIIFLIIIDFFDKRKQKS